MLSAPCRIMCSPRANTWEDTLADCLGPPSPLNQFCKSSYLRNFYVFYILITFFVPLCLVRATIYSVLTRFLPSSKERDGSLLDHAQECARAGLDRSSFSGSHLGAFRFLLGRLTIFGDAPSAPEDRGGARTAACRKESASGFSPRFCSQVTDLGGGR